MSNGESVGTDFPFQVLRVQKLREDYMALPKGVGAYGALELRRMLERAAEAQASGDIVRILRSYSELTEAE